MSRFTRLWSIILVPLIAGGLLIPLAAGDPGVSDRGERERLAADTLRSGQRLRAAERNVTLAESLHTEARSAGALAPRIAAPTPRRLTPAVQAPVGDPAVDALAALILEARRLRTPAAWLAVAANPLVNGGPRMRALADSLETLARERESLPSGPARDQQAAPLTAAISRVGYTMLAIAENRRVTLAAEQGAGDTAPEPVSATEQPPPPAARAAATADTTETSQRLADARDTLLVVQRAHEGALAAALPSTSVGSSAGPSTLATFSPALGLVALFIGGLAVRFGLALSRESKIPTIANATEAERAIGASVLATVRDAPLDGPARFRPSGVDPFRMLYLGLTATGTRARTMIVTGGDAEIVAAVGARLAISAAADHRATLVVDIDPIGIALARSFRERAEPGLTDALAGAFKWREVARPVGSSDGLPITMMPAGTERDLPAGAEFSERREELAKFRSSFEFTILVAPARSLELAISLVEPSPLVLCAAVGETTLEAFSAESSALRRDGRRLHGVVLWDAPRPKLPTRAELAAMLATRKGRTPGGSFAAVQKAIEGTDKRQR